MLGRITKKTDLAATGTWTYDATKKHRILNAAGAVTYTYDANGNAITRNGAANPITWTSYNYPRAIVQGAESEEFAYGPGRERWHHFYDGPNYDETTTSIGGLLERVQRTTASFGTQWRHWIVAGDRTVALVTRKQAGSHTTKYLIHDHQGNIAGMLTASGTLQFGESFTAYGQRRNALTWSLPITSGQAITIADTSRRGYTEHTHLAASPLIHMNGRVQDPTTGVFLSPDPIMADPQRTTAWNPYSYVYNAPLDYIDPTGFCTPDDCLDPRGPGLGSDGLPYGPPPFSGFDNYGGAGVPRGSGSSAVPHDAADATFDFASLSTVGGTIGPYHPLFRDNFAGRTLQSIDYSFGWLTQVFWDGPVRGLFSNQIPSGRELNDAKMGVLLAALPLSRLSAAARATVPQVLRNKAAGDAFRDVLAADLQAAGREVTTEVYKRTPFGKRFIDIEVSQNGTVLGGIETKVGASRYTPLQRLKDWWLTNIEGYPVNVARSP